MARGERPISRAKTTENLKVGMHVLVNDRDGAKTAVITYIFDRWMVGTNLGSRWADNIHVINTK